MDVNANMGGMGGYGITPVVNVGQPAMYGGNCGSMLGGGACGAGGLVLGFLLAAVLRGGAFGGFNGGNGGTANDTLSVITNQNLNSRFDALGGQVAAGSVASVNATQQQGLVQATANISDKICDAISATYSTSAQGRLDTANTTGLINSNIQENKYAGLLATSGLSAQTAASFALTDRGVLENRYLAAQNTCAIISNADANKNEILAALTAGEIQRLRDANITQTLKLSQCEQNSFLVSMIRPYPNPSYPVGAPNTPIFPCRPAPVGVPNNGCGCGNF